MSRRRNGNGCVQWFLTYPHSGEYTPKSFFLTLFTLGCITGVAGCRETHSDGITPHLHLNFKLKYKLTKVQILNKFKRIHPNDYMRINIQTTRQTPDQAREGYLAKENKVEDIWFWTDDELEEEKKMKKKLEDYNRKCKMLSSHEYGSRTAEEYWGYINVAETLKKNKWNYALNLKENFNNDAVIFSIYPDEPWWKEEFIEM